MSCDGRNQSLSAGPAGAAGTSRATFAFDNSQFIFPGPTPMKVLSKILPAGNWVFVATARLTGGSSTDKPNTGSRCELRNGANVVVGGSGSGLAPSVWNTTLYTGEASITVNGGAALPAGGEISLWCMVTGVTFGAVQERQMAIWEVSSFF